MDVNQFAVYQLKSIPQNRDIRFRPYIKLKENGIPVRADNYNQVYLGRLQAGDTPADIRRRFHEKPPRNFHGHSISVSDVLVLNQSGVVTCHYVEKEGFTVFGGFIRNSSSGAHISLETTGHHIEGKVGKWVAYDSIIVDGKEFFLMEHMAYGSEASNVVLDIDGNLVADDVRHGFDETVCQQIRDYLNPSTVPQKEEKAENLPLEAWQKSYENGEYLRSAEMAEEQNYNMIDGRMNNLPNKPRKIGNRISVLDRLHLKQAAITERNIKPVPQRAVMEDMERRWK